MITIHHKRKKLFARDTLLEYNFQIFDVTSKSSNQFIKFSPFYPHGNIPIPFSDGYYSQTVEGVWQGLKFIENKGIDESKFHITNMKNIKRKGNIIGHQKGITSNNYLSYIDARLEIYIPTYNWVLENKLQELVKEIYTASKEKDIILLDYTTNENIHDIKTPLSHAYLIKKYIESNY